MLGSAGLVALVHLQAHSVVDLVVRQRDVVLVDRVPFLELDLGMVGARLRRDELLEIAHGVVRAALDAHFAPKTIVRDNLD